MKVTECAVISSKTRESAESIGHSINTMLSRLSRITTTGFNEEDDTKINDVAKALNSVDIALTDSSGNFRDFGIIMDEINAKWSSLDDQTQSYIANTMAGTRQQSRFFNLMNGYAESMELYEQSLEAAGTAQSKFNLYLESNQATIDKFRTTLEGLWITIVDSDSLMNIVRAGTSFIELLDSMIDKLGVTGTALNFIIPLLGIKLVWAIRAAYIEMVKLQATGSMSAFMPTSKILGQIIKQMLGLTTAAGGATVAVGGLTLATAGLTAGVGLLAFAIVKWTQKSREAKEAFASALDNSQKLNDEVEYLENLAKKQEQLTKIENKSVEQKQELLAVQKELAQAYPELATGIDAEGNKIAENLEMTKQLTEEKRKLLEQELLVIKTTADARLPQLRQELADMQDEANEIQQKLATGNTRELVTIYDEYGEKIEYVSDRTKYYQDRLLELVEAQKANYEETAKLESGVKSYNNILEENAERHKWLTAETLALEAVMDNSQSNIARVEQELKKLGFTSDDVANIVNGNLSEVKKKYDVLTDAQILNYQTVQDLNKADRVAATDMLERSKTLTEQTIENTKARILAIKAEIEALVGRDGAGATYLDKTFGMHPAKQALSDELKKQQEDLVKETHDNLKRLSEIDAALSNIDEIRARSGSISGTKDPKKEKKDNRQFLETIDAEIRAIKIRNDYLLSTEELLKKQLELSKNIEGIEGLNEQYRLTGELIAHNEKMLESFKEEQDLIHVRANKLREQYSKYDIDSWFDSNGEQSLTYINLFNKSTKEQQDELNKVFNTMQKLKGAWAESSNEAKNMKSIIEDLGRELDNHPNKVRSIVKELIEAEKRNAQLDLERRQRIANEELRRAKQEMEDEVKGAQSEIDRIQNEIDRMQESERARQERLERAEKLQEITDLQNKHYFLQNKHLADLTEEQAKQLGLEREREDYLKMQEKILEEQEKRQEYQNELLELRNKLDNVRNEKNIQQLKKMEDGSFQFEYVADQREIDKVEDQIKDVEKKIENSHKQIEQLEKDHNKALEKLKEQTLESLQNAQKKYDKWEYQNDLRRQIEAKQRRIKRYQDEIRDLQDKYSEQEKLTNEAFAIEKENLDRHYMDIDKLTDEAMKGLENTFDSNWSEITNTITGYFSRIESEYQRLIDTLSKPIQMPSIQGGKGGGQYGGGGGGGFYESPDGGNPSPSKELGESGSSESGGKTDWSLMYNDARDKGDWKTMEYANRQANIDRGLGDVVTSGVDIESIKKKYGGSFKHGAEVLSSGLMLTEFHGRKNDPEWIFNSNQLHKVLKSSVLSTIKAIVPKVPSPVLANMGTGDTMYYIDKLELPGVTDFESFKKDASKGIDNLPNKAIMRVKKIGK